MFKNLAIFLLTTAVLFAAGCDKAKDTDTSTNPGGGGGGGGTSGAAITVGSVDGLAGTGLIHANQTITIHWTYTNNTGKTIVGFTNGWKIYSPDGATWNTVSGDKADITDQMMDLILTFTYFSVDGVGTDTVGFGGARLSGGGIPDGFSGEGCSVSFGPISSGYIGKTICIDSTFWPPGGAWLWSLEGGTNAYPEWGGPYCWTITN